MIAQASPEMPAGGPSAGRIPEFSMVVFDIETGPAPAEIIELHMPEFDAPANYKDPAKIEAVLAEKRAAWTTKAALSPLTGRILAVGLWADGSYSARIVEDSSEASEKALLKWFWKHVTIRTALVGWNSNRFDLPFLLKRSWALGVCVPFGLAPGGRLDSRLCVDLMEYWQLGDKNNFASLDSIARYLDVGSKSGDGEFFHQVLKAFPEEAEAYLRNDVKLTFEVAKKFGLIDDEMCFEPFTADAEPEPATADVDDY